FMFAYFCVCMYSTFHSRFLYVCLHFPVCMYVCMYICIRLSSPVCTLHKCVCVCLCVCVCVCVCVDRERFSSPVCTLHKCLCVCVCVCVCVCEGVGVCVTLDLVINNIYVRSE